MLVVTHEMGFAREVADRVVVMAEGKIIEQGPPDELFRAPRDPRTRALIEGYRSGARDDGGDRKPARGKRLPVNTTR